MYDELNCFEEELYTNEIKPYMNIVKQETHEYVFSSLGLIRSV